MMSKARQLTAMVFVYTNHVFLACLGMVQRVPPVARGTGEWVATSTGNFSHFYLGKVVN